MDELVRLLHAEYERLGWVCYRTVVAVLLLRNEETRFLAGATDEVHDAVDRLDAVDRERAAAASRVASELGLAGDPVTLEDIIRAVPWSTARRLLKLQHQLRSLQAELEELSGVGSVVADAKLETVRRSLGRWGASPASAYGAPPPSGAWRLDEAF